jgi:AraC family transcriptional regulator
MSPHPGIVMESWRKVRKELGVRPIVEGMIGGDSPLFVERYLFHSIEKSVSGLRGMGLLTQLGGSRVHEGERGEWRADVLPSQSLLVPANCPTHWHYSGTVDFAVFYFPDHVTGIQERLRLLAESRRKPMTFGDALVGASALQLVNELHKGGGADEHFMMAVTAVMLEQTWRVLTTPGTHGINPRHVHFSRLQAVLGHIHEHLNEDLSLEALAGRAQVSTAHFRRLFQEAMGVPPHRYVLAARLTQARKLLTMTALPIARIAHDCGFSSQSHLTASFRAAHAATPAGYRAQARR